MIQPVVLGFLGPKVVSTLTPLWILGLGTTLGIALIVVFWALLLVLSRVTGLPGLKRATAETWLSIREGVLYYVLIVAAVLAGISLLCTFSLRSFGESAEILASIPRLLEVGESEYAITVEGTAFPEGDEFLLPPATELPIMFRGEELIAIEVNSTENVAISQEPDTELDTMDSTNVKAGEPVTWNRRPNSKSPFGDEVVNTLFVRNRSEDAAEISIAITTEVVYPEVKAILITAVALFGVFLVYFLQAMLLPRLSAIALATFKSEIAQPLFIIVLVLGIVSIVISIYIPYNTFGEDIKMLKDSGLTMIRVLCIMLAVWGASTTLADEVEGKTAMTVLSKPIQRRSFVVGKFLGIGWTSALMFIVLGAVLLAVVSYKLVYDARETSADLPTWQACYLEMMSTVPGLLLAFMETMILAALSVAISTRLPMFANFMICFTVYVLGHLIPLISQATEGQFEIVKFVGRFSAAIFPNLEAFDLQTAMAGGFAVPHQYLGMSLVYCLLFSTVAMLLALILFEDRDLA